VLLQSGVQAHGQAQVQSEASAGLGNLIEGIFDTAGKRMQDALEAARKLSKSQEKKPLFDNPGIISLERTHLEGETGAVMDLHVRQKMGCDNCQLAWGDKIKVTNKVHLPAGLRPGDRLALDLDMNFDVGNTDSPFSTFFFGDTMNVKTICDFCDGSCHVATAKHNDSLSLIMPTLLRNASGSCDEERHVVPGVTDVLVLDRRMKLPEVNSAKLKLLGHINLTMTVLSSYGHPKVGSSLLMRFEPSESSVAGEAIPPIQLAQGRWARARKARQLQQWDDGDEEAAQAEAEAEKQPWTLPGLLQTATSQVLQRATDAAVAAGGLSKGGKRGVGNVIVTDITVRQLDQGSKSNVSFTGGACRQKGPLGSVACYYPFGRKSKVATDLHLAWDLEPDSNLHLWVKPRFKGMLARALSNNLLRTYDVVDQELPACGENPSIVYFQEAGGLNARWYTPPKCGLFKLDLTLGQKKVSMPDAKSFKVPELLLNILKMPPLPALDVTEWPCVSADIRVLLKHRDDSVIADIDLHLGFDKTG